ncbi:MAG: hypothetical protein MZW92_13350 [Comamonadaceae bacterium]|nr:hypothetical protein [Comamonadaceae bacterium]
MFILKKVLAALLPPPLGPLLLVAHATHLQRAQAEFAAAGIETIPAPTAFLRSPATRGTMLNEFPNASTANAGWYAVHRVARSAGAEAGFRRLRSRRSADGPLSRSRRTPHDPRVQELPASTTTQSARSAALGAFAQRGHAFSIASRVRPDRDLPVLDFPDKSEIRADRVVEGDCGIDGHAPRRDRTGLAVEFESLGDRDVESVLRNDDPGRCAFPDHSRPRRLDVPAGRRRLCAVDPRHGRVSSAGDGGAEVGHLLSQHASSTCPTLSGPIVTRGVETVSPFSATGQKVDHLLQPGIALRQARGR